MTPSYEKPVETAEDIVKRDIIPFIRPYGYENVKQSFADSNNLNYQEISRRLLTPKYNIHVMYYAYLMNATGSHSQIGNVPAVYEDEYKYYYRSSEPIGGFNPYLVHLSNKKWPLKKVF